MNPDTRMTLSLVLSLAVSAPNLRLAAAGHADIVDVGLRYVVAFVLAFAIVGAIGRVFNDYLEAAAAASSPVEGDGAPGAEPMRLAADDS